MGKTKTIQGFTIVELLIVIVVIAILAALVIVAYNGIQQRARVSSLQSELASIGKKLESFKFQNTAEQYPSTLAAAQVALTSGFTYEYVYNSTDNSYCLEGIVEGNRYFVSSVQNTVTSGQCGQNDIVGFWRFNGNADDSSGNGLNGNASGVTLTTGQNGQANGAYSFPGTAAYVWFGNMAQFNQTEFTMSIWMRTNSTSGLQTLMAKELKYKYRLAGGSTLTMLMAPQTSWTTRSCVFNYVAGSWYHVIWTYSSSKGISEVFVNGTRLCEQPVPAITAPNAQPLMVGAHNVGGGEGFNGDLDDARFYKRALTGAEAKSLFDRGAQ